MARGADAKKAIIDRLEKTFGDDFAGVVDGKVYLWAKEGGERLQICLSLTCPKNPIAAGGAPTTTGSLDFGGGLDFEAMGGGDPLPNKQAEITDQEKKNIEDLFARLGL